MPSAEGRRGNVSPAVWRTVLERSDAPRPWPWVELAQAPATPAHSVLGEGFHSGAKYGSMGRAASIARPAAD